MASKVIFFDGYCGVCDAAVSALIPSAGSAGLLFAPLQGDTFQKVLARHPELRGIDSVVFVEDLGPGERVSVRGDAALRVLRRLGGAWWIPRVVVGLAPRALRDRLYDLFARYRHRLAARRDSCRLPTMAERKLFLP
jgi:predicted DCC family thiol-disulfide oxidoreductase YuxK